MQSNNKYQLLLYERRLKSIANRFSLELEAPASNLLDTKHGTQTSLNHNSHEIFSLELEAPSSNLLDTKHGTQLSLFIDFNPTNRFLLSQSLLNATKKDVTCYVS